MNPFALAAELLGGIELGPEQLAQLRALDRRYQQRRFGPGREEDELRAELTAEILELLTPEQRRTINR